MKNKKLIVAAWLMLIGMSLPTMAQSLAYVDAIRLIDESPQGKEEIESLESKFSERNAELKGQIEQYGEEEADLKKNAAILSEEELQKKTKLLRDQQFQLQREQHIYTEEYSRARNEGLARLEKLISEEISKFAEEQKIDLVVQQAVYASKQIDITDKVLARLKANAK